VSLFASLFLLANSVIFIPIAKQLNKNFIEYKKLQSKINIKETSYGQKFENWSVYINDVKDGSYKNIILYNQNPEKNEERFVIAKEANIDKNGSDISINLKDGKLYNLHPKSIDEFSYSGMKMSYKPDIKELEFSTVYEYWQKAKESKQRAKDLSINILISFFPLATFLFAISFGVANTRHEKPNIYLHIFIVVLIFYLLMYKVSLSYPLYGTGILLVLFHLASGLFFKKKILSRY
jgi:lipopolysaccharide export system permease protein